MSGFCYETTIQLGCEVCPNKRTYRIGHAAIACLANVDTAEIPVVAKEELSFEVSAEVIDGFGNKTIKNSNQMIVNSFNADGLPDCEESCNSADKIVTAGNQIEQRIISLAQQITR